MLMAVVTFAEKTRIYVRYPGASVARYCKNKPRSCADIGVVDVYCSDIRPSVDSQTAVF